MRPRPPELTVCGLADLQARRLYIEANEPPVHGVLDATCRDELITALGYNPGERTNVTLCQRVLRNIVDFRADRIRTRADLSYKLPTRPDRPRRCCAGCEGPEPLSLRASSRAAAGEFQPSLASLAPAAGARRQRAASPP